MKDIKKVLIETIEALQTIDATDDLLEKAIESYGEEAQTDKAIEEMAELTKALLKYRLNPNSGYRDNVLEEMADVSIMLDQLQMIYGDYTAKRSKKLNRLAMRLGFI